MSDAKTAVDLINKSLATLPKTIPQQFQSDVKAYVDAAKDVASDVQASADTADTKNKRDKLKTAETALSTAQTKLDTANKAADAANKDKNEKFANVTGAKAQLGQSLKGQVQSLDRAKTKLQKVTAAAQKVGTALNGQTQSPQKDIAASVGKGYLDIARAVRSVDPPQ